MLARSLRRRCYSNRVKLGIGDDARAVLATRGDGKRLSYRRVNAA